MQDKDSRSAQIVFWHAKGGEWGRAVCTIPDVIDAHHGNIIWDAQSGILNRIHCAYGCPVTNRKNSGGRFRKR